MPLLDPNIKQQINEHEQKDAIGIGTRAFTKSLLAATEVATQIASAPPTPRADVISTGNGETAKDKLIDPNIKKALQESGHAESIKTLLDSMLPKMLKTLETVATIGSEFGADMVQTAIEGAVPGDDGKKIAGLAKNVVKGGSESLSAGVATTNETLEKSKPLIHPEVKAAIKAHPHFEAIKSGVKSFLKKFLPELEKAAAVGSEIGAKITTDAIEAVVEGDKGKTVAKMASVSITGTGKGFGAAIEETEANMAIKLLDPVLKAKIEAHPHREAVKEFLKNFLPKILKALETVAAIAGPLLGDMTEDAIKAAMPGATGEKLAKMAEKMVDNTTTSVGKALGNIKTTTVTVTEVKMIPNDTAHPNTPINVSKVVDLDPHHVDLTGADHVVHDITH